MEVGEASGIFGRIHVAVVAAQEGKNAVAVFFKGEQVVHPIQVKVYFREAHAIDAAGPWQFQRMARTGHGDVLVAEETVILGKVLRRKVAGKAGENQKDGGLEKSVRLHSIGLSDAQTLSFADEIAPQMVQFFDFGDRSMVFLGDSA